MSGRKCIYVWKKIYLCLEEGNIQFFLINITTSVYYERNVHNKNRKYLRIHNIRIM